MKRPLAACGFCFLLASLAACLLPAGLLLPLAAGLGVLFLAVFLARRKNRRKSKNAILPLLLCTAALALGWRAGYDALITRPVAALADTEATALARVEDVAPGYGGDTVHATLTVLALDGVTQRPFRVEVRGMPEVAIGDELEVPLRFYAFSNATSASIGGARGQYIGARAAAAPIRVGESLSLTARLRLWRYAAGDSIGEKLPQRLSSVAAAMSVGDRRFVSAETAEAYRMAGLSHLLVVSGLHLSILAGLVYGVFNILLRRRQIAAGIAIAAVLLFMAFTGFTPSIVRSGVAALLVLAGPLLKRRADIFTSLGLAGLLLCLQNPYAAADAGLLLSFSATLGAIAGGSVAARLERGRGERHILAKIGWYAAGLALVSVFVSFATLPVLIWISGGVSLLGVPMNVLAVPLLAPIIVCGLVMVLPGAGPLLLLTQPASLLGGGLLVFLEKLTGFAADHPRLYLPAGGLYGLLVVLLLYGIIFLAWKTRYHKSYLVAAAALAVFAVGLHFALSAGTVRLTVAGSGAASSLVVARGGEAVVLYRGRLSSAAIDRALHNQRAEAVLFVDLRRDPQSTEYIGLFDPDEVVVAADDLTGQTILTPFEGVDIYLKEQGGGTVACVDIEGYKVALATGSVDLSGYAAVDVLIAGSGEVRGDYDILLAAGTAPDWADGEAALLYSDGTPQILIRPGKSVLFRETRPALD